LLLFEYYCNIVCHFTCIIHALYGQLVVSISDICLVNDQNSAECVLDVYTESSIYR